MWSPLPQRTRTRKQARAFTKELNRFVDAQVAIENDKEYARLVGELKRARTHNKIMRYLGDLSEYYGYNRVQLPNDFINWLREKKSPTDKNVVELMELLDDMKI